MHQLNTLAHNLTAAQEDTFEDLACAFLELEGSFDPDALTFTRPQGEWVAEYEGNSGTYTTPRCLSQEHALDTLLEMCEEMTDELGL